MRSRRQETLAFVAALAFHFGALVTLGALVGEPKSTARLSPPLRAATSDGAFEIDLGEPPLGQTAREVELPLARTPSERAALPRYAAPSSRRDGVTASEIRAAPEPPELDESPATLEPSPNGGDAARPLDLGIGPDGWQRWVGAQKDVAQARRERAGPRTNRFQVFRAPPVSSTGGLLEGLEAHDRKLGLGPSGRVLSAVHRAAHESAAPQVGVARFDVTVLRSGAVEVSLGSATGEVEAWRKVAKHVADNLRAALPQIPEPREGMRLVIELTAEYIMPNGTKLTELEAPHLEATAPKLKTTEQSQKDLSADNPTTTEPTAHTAPIQLDLPGVFLAGRGKVCSYRLGVVPLGLVFQGGCDPSNLGAKPQRMVHAEVVEQNLF